MAKNRIDYDFDDEGSMDFGNDFDDAFGEFDADETPKKRNPVVRLGGKFFGGIKGALFSKSTQREFLQKNLPDGYSTLYDAADTGVLAGKDLYNTAKEGSAASVKELKKGARVISKELKGKRTKWLGDKLGKFGQVEDSYSSEKVNPDDLELASIMGAMFQEQQAKDSSEEPTSKREAISNELQAEQTRAGVQTNMQLGSLTSEITQLRLNSDKMLSYQDQVTTSYRRKMLEVNIRHYLTSRKTTDLTKQALELSKSAYEKLIHNTGLPDLVKTQSLEIGHQLLKEKFFGNAINGFNDRFGDVGNRIIKKSQGEVKRFFKDMGATISSGVMGASELAETFGSGNDPEMGGDNYTDMAAGMAGGAVASKASRWIGKKLGGRLRNNDRLMQYGMAGQNALSNLSRTFNESLSADTGNSLMEFLKYTGFLDEFRYRQDDVLRTDATSELDKAAAFDLQTKKTVTEVIPKLLSKIYGETRSMRLTWGGEEPDEIQYSFKTGRFTSSSALKTEIKDSIIGEKKVKNAAVAVNKLMDTVDPDGTLSKDARDALKKYFVSRARQGRDYGIIRLARGDAEGFKASPGVQTEVATHMKMRFDFTDKQLDEAAGGLVKEMAAMAKGGSAQQLVTKQFLDEARGLTVELNGEAKKKALEYTRSGNVEQLLELGLATQDKDSGRLDLNTGFIDDAIVTHSETAGNVSEKEQKQSADQIARDEALKRVLAGDSKMAKRLARRQELAKAKTKEEREAIAARHAAEDGAPEDAAESSMYDTGMSWFNTNVLSRAGIAGFDPKKSYKEFEEKIKKEMIERGISAESEEGKRRIDDLRQRMNGWIDNAGGEFDRMDEEDAGRLGTFTRRFGINGRNTLKGLRDILREGKTDLELAEAATEGDPVVTNEEEPKSGQNHTGGVVGDRKNRQVKTPDVLLGVPKYHTGGIAGDMPDVEVREGKKKGEFFTTAPDGTVVTWRDPSYSPRKGKGGLEAAKARIAKKHAEKYGRRTPSKLKPNEIGTVLEVGEEVLTADDPRHRDNIAETLGADGPKESLRKRLKDKAKKGFDWIKGKAKQGLDWAKGKVRGLIHGKDAETTGAHEDTMSRLAVDSPAGTAPSSGKRSSAIDALKPSGDKDPIATLYDHVGYIRSTQDEVVGLLKVIAEKPFGGYEKKPGVMDWIKDKSKRIAGGTKRAYERASVSVSKGLSFIRSKLPAKFEQGLDWLKEKTSHLTLDNLKAKAKQGLEWAKEKTHGVTLANAKDKLKHGVDWLKLKKDELLQSNLGAKAKNAFNTAREKVTSIKDKGVAKAKDLLALARKNIPNKERVKEHGLKAKDYALGKLKGVKDSLLERIPLVKDFVKNAFNRIGRIKKHIYVVGEKQPAITHEQLMSGALIDANSLMRVNTIEDITGPVITQDGEIVLSYEQFNKGLYVGSLLTRAKKLVSDMRNNAKLLLENPGFHLKNMVLIAKSKLYSDVYLKGTDQILIGARDLAAGKCTDIKTGNVVKSIKDITGAVKGADGNVVITQEQFDQGIESREGFVKGLAKRAGQFVQKGLKKISNFLGIDGKVKGFLNRRMKATDVFVKGEEKPRLTYIGMVSGKYFNADGTPCSNLATASIPIKDAEGNVLLSEEDIKTGIVDGLHRPLVIGKAAFGLQLGRGISDRLGSIGARVKAVAKTVGKAVGKVAKAAWNIVSFKGVRNWLKGRKNKGVSQSDVAAMTDPLDVAKATLANVIGIREFLDRSARPKKKAFNDLDGDGVRDGSGHRKGILDRARDWAKEKKDKVVGKVKDIGSGLMSKLSGLVPPGVLKALGGAGIGALLMNTLTGDGEFSVAKTVAGGALGAAAPFLAVSGVKAAGKLAAKGAGYVARNGASLAVQAGKKAIPWLARAAIPSLLSAGGSIASGLAAGAAGLGALISAPVVLAVAGAALLIGGGYLLYKQLTKKKLPVMKFRMAQYGYKHDDEKHVTKILDMEKRLLASTTCTGAAAKIGNDVQAEEFLKLFEVDIEDKDKTTNWLRWFHYRFKPVYLSHVTALYRATKKTDIHKADEFLGRTEKLTYLKSVHYKSGKASPYSVKSDPFNEWHFFGGLLDTGDVNDIFEDAIKMADNEAEKSGQASTGDKQDAKKQDAAKKSDAANEAHKKEDARLKEEEAAKQGILAQAWESVKRWNPITAPLTVAKDLLDGFKNPNKDDPSLLNSVGAGARELSDSIGFTSSASMLGKSQKEYQMMVFTAFKNAGFSDPQAKAMTAEVGRENDYVGKYLFGRHADPKNKIVNQGFFSWQDQPGSAPGTGRRSKLLARMSAAGLVDAKGNFIPGQESLNQMALFAKDEINSLYPKTRSRFLGNPAIDSEEAAQVLGRDYIRWAIDNPKYSAKGQSRRRAHLASLNKQLGEQGGGAVPAAAPGTLGTPSPVQAKAPVQTGAPVQQGAQPSGSTQVYTPGPVVASTGTAAKTGGGGGGGGGAASTAKAFYIGDSIADGHKNANKADGNTKIGRSPAQVRDAITSIAAGNPDALRGKAVFLSSGLSNNPVDLVNVEKQLDMLKRMGAKVTLSGVSNSYPKGDPNKMNAALAQLASKYGAAFTGGFTAGKDNVHPKAYGGASSVPVSSGTTQGGATQPVQTPQASGAAPSNGAGIVRGITPGQPQQTQYVITGPSGGRPPQGSQPERMAAFAAARARSSSSGYCARYVSDAMQHAGYRITRGNADTYVRNALQPAGFQMIAWGSAPQVGDIVHWAQTGKHRYGHIQIWTGQNWVSDFVQRRIVPWRDPDGSKGTHWRDGRFMNGTRPLVYNPGVGSTTIPATAGQSEGSYAAAQGSGSSGGGGSTPMMMTPGGSIAPMQQQRPVAMADARQASALLKVSRDMLGEMSKMVSAQNRTNELLTDLCKMLGKDPGGSTPTKSAKPTTTRKSTEVPATEMPISLNYH